MSDVKAAERKLVVAQVEVVRAKLRETGATVLSPTVEWAALRKELLELNKRLR